MWRGQTGGNQDYMPGCCYEITASTLAIIGVAATLTGTAVSGYGMMKQAQAKSEQDAYNAQVAANNQKLADAAATQAEQAGLVAQQQKANAENVLIGQQKASLAANGVDVGSGSALDLLSDTKAAGEFDQLTIAQNTARTATNYRNQGINYSNQAQLDSMSSQNALTGGYLSAAATIASGAGSVASQWYNFNYGTKTNTSVGQRVA